MIAISFVGSGTTLTLPVQALRIAPSPAHAQATGNVSASALDAPSAPGLADPLRNKLSSLDAASSLPSAQVPESSHALENRLLQWRSTQQALKTENLRRIYGAAEPIRRGMELETAKSGEWRAQALGGSASVSSDILEGRDATCEWEDIFKGIAATSRTLGLC